MAESLLRIKSKRNVGWAQNFISDCQRHVGFWLRNDKFVTGWWTEYGPWKYFWRNLQFFPCQERWHDTSTSKKNWAKDHVTKTLVQICHHFTLLLLQQCFLAPQKGAFFVPKVTFVKLFVRLIWQEIVWLRLVCGLVICECICLSTVFDENLEGEERNILLPLFLLSKACFATLRNFFKATCFNLCLSTTSLFISKTWILDGDTSQSWNND